MAWYHFFTTRPSTAQLIKLAHTVARSQHHQVLTKSRGTALGMSRAESNGYVRVQAATVMRKELRRVIQVNHDLGDWAFDTLLSHSVEAVVQLVSGDLQRLRAATAPVRRAA
ncbi:MAG: hypothetical protein SGJ19_20830 [Planctomycetia bacterium]|nr:hypothetical protein [Planctomycetia bacterium]